MTLTRDDVRTWDATDPLRSFRDQFVLPQGVIYLDGNSLGPLPRATAVRLKDVVDGEWGTGLIRSWNDADWIGAPQRVGAKIARLIGAAADEVVVADSTSVNIYKLLAAALAARPGRRVILTQAGDFPTDTYMAQGLAVLASDVDVRSVTGDICAAMDESVAAVLLSHVHYKTAARHDMVAMTSAVRAAGALVVWDLSHSAGAVEVDLTASGVDLAVGCGYKFLNGGPGAPAFLFVARHLQACLNSPLSGWMGHAAPFAFEGDYRPAAGIDRFLCGTPPILSLAALEVGVDLALAVDMALVAEKSARLWELFASQIQGRCGDMGFTLISPSEASRRGSHIAFAHRSAYPIIQALIARGVIGDYRDPDILRFGLTPLYLRYQDVVGAVEILREVVETEAWRAFPTEAGGRVT